MAGACEQPRPEPAGGPEPATAPGARNLRAYGTDRVYQAAGNQYIYQKPPPAPATASNILPRDTPAFTGRERELRRLLDRVTAPDADGAPLPIYTIEGMPGVGKSALAVHAGHVLATRFPDGQFFIDLHGYTAGRTPVRPAEALYALLCADGVAPARVPDGVDARAASWRGRMAGKRALLILDNAAGRWQVEQLLPGGAGCLVLVTSRRRLAGLGAQQAAETLSLGTLPPEDATALFSTVAGRPGGDEADAVEELVHRCGLLPLAICLLAAKLRPEPGWRVADLVREMGPARHPLGAMRAEDVAVDAAFDLSYRLLPLTRRRFLRRLSLHPGPDLDAYAAAALDGTTLQRARRQLDALYEDHLLDQPVLGRYRLHDLIGEYARAKADDDPGRERDDAVGRLLDYYQHGAHLADRRLSRPGRPAGGAAVRPGPAVPELPDDRMAAAWLERERANLVACATLLHREPEPRRLIDLAAALAAYLRKTGPWEQAIALHRAAARAALETGDPLAEADARRELGLAYGLTGRYPQAEEALGQALELYLRLGRDDRRANALTQLATLRRRRGEPLAAVAELEQALALCQRLGDPYGHADVLDELGVVRHLTGDHAGAVRILRESLAIREELDDDHGQASTLKQLGTLQQRSCEYRAAKEAYERALVLYRRLGDRNGQDRVLGLQGLVLIELGEHRAAERTLTETLRRHRELGYRQGEAHALNYLGDLHSRTGEYAAAERELAEALRLYREIEDPDGEADALNLLGVLLRLRGEHGAARDACERALALFRRRGLCLGQAEALNQLGLLLLTGNEPTEAAGRYRAALRLARRAGNPREEARALAGIGRCAQRLGNSRDAAQKLRQARAIHERIGAVPEAWAASDGEVLLPEAS
ncbi:tetratricopeptide repeat protein [Micromonospora sp. NPDC049559]|uniref:tetratricopeptide repeat protein n=1 Tax=Micromonospora sp. NPDC049559 TaxID=3155923 RepID=UPI00342D613A